jgi:PDZ domain-containing protein
VLGVGIAGILVLSLLPSPYAIEQPGPVFNTLGEVRVDDATVPLISVPGQKTYPTEGALDMLTVNVLGSPEQHANWFEIVSAWADPSKAVVPLDSVYPPGETVKQSNEQSAIDMQNSQKDAIAASLTELGYTFPSTLTVAAFSLNSPSDGILEEGDQITAVNGVKPTDVTQLRSIISANGTAKPVSLAIVRAGAARTVAVTPIPNPEDGGKAIVGIVVGADYDFPFDVKIQLENVGGPSAGMMFALGIIDKLTPGLLNGGEKVAGTGTITADGQVGPIGGIRQKLYGARNEGASFFLAPESNCDDVTGHIPAGLTVFAVSTLSQALAALEVVAAKGDTKSLPSCPAG